MAADTPLEQVAANHPTHITPETLAEIEKNLAKIK
jgi:hypothetical protein